MHTLSRFFGWMLYHGPLKPRLARAKRHDSGWQSNRCACGALRVPDSEGDMHCPRGCFTLPASVVWPQTEVHRTHVEAIRTRLDVLEFGEGPAPQGLDLSNMPYSWADTDVAQDAWLNSPPPVQMSPEQTTEHRTPGMHYLKYERYRAEQLYGRKRPS